MHPITFSPSQNAGEVTSSRARFLPDALREWSGTSTEYPRNATVSALFEEIVELYPGATCLVERDVEITYAELNTRANRLAHRLRRAGLKPDAMVACCFERSIDMIVAFVGVLKAGGAYVPLDPTYPKSRLDFILEDTGNPLIVTRSSFAPLLYIQHSSQVLLLDEEATASSSTTDDQNPFPVAGPTNLGYVMYTSGSTGKPKGVLIENRGIVRLVRGTNYCHFGPEETFLHFAPPAFDASTFEIWGALLNGGRLVLMPAESSSLEDLGRAIRKYRVTTLWLTAGLFHLMVEERPQDLQPLRQLLAGGDVLSPLHARMFLEQAPHTTLINGYGPTENTTFTCCHGMRSGDSLPASIPVGRPVSNTYVYILDHGGNAVALGEVGELYAGGDGVARGYLNDPVMTAQKFMPDPFTQEPEQRMYRTGDLARWRADGTVEFVGRVDSQIKILGYRIEPGEIEAVLQRHPAVKQACVVALTDDGTKRLAAYFVASNPNVTADDLREFVAAQLPQHMIPAFFVELPALPLSEHGKVDRPALAQRGIPARQQAIKASKEVTNSLERTITELWRRILKVPHVGLDDNFFDLGGDSLLLVAVHSNLQKTLQSEISLTDLFEFATVRKLSDHLSHAEPASPSLSGEQERAQRQREAFTRFRGRRSGGDS
jgi:amino acid adenylation domain-containing protein